ncbi:MAG: EamA family transporter RarD [Bdellovibrionales bacterium]|nr:EamA family transporter RarD [Bdellovibrionales bacterium]
MEAKDLTPSLDRKGLFWGFVSYFLWGFFPLYWKMLQGTSALEILAHRMAWAFLFYLAIFLFFSDQKVTTLLQQSRKDWMLSVLAGILLSFNWGIYIYAVNSGHILEGSLAYFINPILNVAVGVFLFKEPFPLVLKLSVGFAALGVATKVGLSPEFPWLSLALAFSFCIYGITKKVLKIPALTSSVLEAMIGFLPALIAIGYFQTRHAEPTPITKWLLFAGAGVVTGLPLFLFSYAAQRIPYSIMGILQFIAPSLQFLVAVLIFSEPLTRESMLSFGLIWVGMSFYLAHQFLKRNGTVQSFF